MMMWGAIEPTETPQTRLRLDFGLRPAIMALNEWAVPGYGGVFFVRQLTWACLGIMLADETKTTASAASIAESLEALAGWIALKWGGYDKDDRVQGKRKLRGLDSISFQSVSSGGAYVTVPFRRAATAALPGLGFCVGTQFRFNALELSTAGFELANAALHDVATAARLRRWIEQPDRPIRNTSQELKQALLPGHETREERELVTRQLMNDPRRARIVRLLAPLDADLAQLRTPADIATFLSQVDDPVHRARLDACFAFERVRAMALRCAQSLADAICATAQPWSALASAQAIQLEFSALQRECSALSERLEKLDHLPAGIREFCLEQDTAASLNQRMRALAARVPQVFSLLPATLDRASGFTDTLVADDDAAGLSGEQDTPTGLLVPRPLLRLKRMCHEIDEDVRYAA